MANNTDTYLQHYLDDNQFVPMRITQLGDGQLRAEIDLSAIHNPTLKENLAHFTDIESNGQAHAFTQQDDLLSVEFAPSLGFHLRINERSIGLFNAEDGQITADEHNADRSLSVSEMRMLSHYMTDYQKQHVPTRRDYVGQLTQEHLPITDLHTHLSSQLSGEELLEIAIQHQLGYPVELLESMGIEVNELPRMKVPTYRFDPAVNTGVALACEQQNDQQTEGVLLSDLKAKAPRRYERLAQKLSIPFDETHGPDDFDKYLYRFRNPLEKNETLAHDKIIAVAQKYKAQGIRYAELSTGAMLNPKWLKEAIPAIEEAEKETGVTLRLLVGIPRTSPPQAVAQSIEKVKFLAKSPYIAGVDFLGFEQGATSNFAWAIYNLARWSRRTRNNVTEREDQQPFRDNFVIRVHAGENTENTKNVHQVISIAEEFGIPMRVGHAIFAGDHPDLLERAKKADITLEVLPDSWLALSNVTHSHLPPIDKQAQSGVRWVMGSDGAGAYQTDSRQTVKSVLAAGVSLNQLLRAQAREEDYISRRLGIFNEKKESFEKDFANLDDFIDQYKDHASKVGEQDLPQRYENKKPILIAGASGTSWEDISPEHKNEIHLATRMMVEMLDPNEVYFATGRVKDRGVEKELDSAIAQHDAKHWRHRPTFDMIATIAPDEGDVPMANGVTWVNYIKGKALNVAKPVIEFMHKHEGVTMLIGGKVLTGEFIREAIKQKIDYALVQGPKGTAHNESQRTAPEHVVAASDTLSLAEAMLARIESKLGQSVFNQEVQAQFERQGVEATLKAYHQQVIEQYNGLHPKAEVDGAATLSHDTISAGESISATRD